MSDSPLPPIMPQWIYYCNEMGRLWQSQYEPRLQAYAQIERPFIDLNERTFVDLNEP